MARKARLVVPNAIYHVYCRTARGERVFAVTTEADAFIETLRAVRDTDQFTILAWCLMGNHYGPCRVSVVRTHRDDRATCPSTR
jgi:REP element-mobilizing transposase RayT